MEIKNLKIGDEVYFSRWGEWPIMRKVKCRFVDFVQSFPDLFECQGMIYKLEDIGKTVFLTRKEAEAALEKMKERDK